jgi:exopolysaccharide biosynthesis predicted pyruvyltransferase EpsI
VAEYLGRFSGERVVYWPNPGNAGDNVIAAATLQLFRALRLKYEFCRPQTDTRGRTVIYGGGGNLTKNYTNARDFILRHHAGAKRLVVLPHTIEGNERLLASLGDNVTVICREKVSFAHVTVAAPRCEVLLGHDMAMSLDADALLRRSRIATLSFRAALALPALRRNDRALARTLGNLADPSTLNCFRGDPESSKTDRPRDSIDISELLRYRCYPEHTCDWVARSFVEAIRRFDLVRTDRLHVAIVAAITGVRSVTLLGGNYFKNRAVYEHSIAVRFPRVVFEDS